MSSQELLSKVRAIKENQQMIDELMAETDALKDAIKAEMNNRNTDEMTIDVFTVRYKPFTTARLDSKALQKELPDVYSRYAKQTTTKRFTIA